MRHSHHRTKLYAEEIGGASHSITPDIPAQSDEENELYAPPVRLPELKKHSPDFIHNQRKLKHLASDRLAHLSNELAKLADEVRYLNPLIAEVLDEAWDATDEALTLINEE